MRIYGPFHMLNNPLVMATLGLQLAGDVAEIGGQIAQHTDEEGIKEALVSGQLQPQVPGGIFRRGLSHLTGGLVSPDASVSSEGLLDQELALRQQQDTSLKDLENFGKFRESLGPDAFGPGSPLSAIGDRLAARASGIATGGITDTSARDARASAALQSPGVRGTAPAAPPAAAPSGINWSAPNLSEQEKQTKIPGTSLFAASQDAAAALAKRKEQEKIDTDTAASNVAKISRAKGAEGAAVVQAETPGMVSRAVQTKAGEAPIEIATNARERINAFNIADEHTFNMKPSEFRLSPKGGVFANRDTLAIATDKDLPNVRAGMANADYVLLSNKDVDSLKATQAHIARLEQLKKLVPQVFPYTSRSNWPSASVARVYRGVGNLLNKGNKPAVDKFYTGLSEQVSFMKQLSGRYNNMELNIPALPDPGALNALGSWDPFKYIPIASSAETATQRLNDMQNTYRNLFVGVANTEDASDFTDYDKDMGLTP